MSKWFWSLLVGGILLQQSSAMAHPGHEVSGFERGPAHYVIEPWHGWLGTPWIAIVCWSLALLLLLPTIARVGSSLINRSQQTD